MEPNNSKKEFHSVIIKHDLYVGICVDGLIVSSNSNKDNKHLYIIGTGISYDTLDYHEWNEFTLILLSEFQIVTAYINIFGIGKLRRRQIQKTDNGNLLLEIINVSEPETTINRITNIRKAFNPNRIPIIKLSQVVDIVQIPTIKSCYTHIDINLGVKFD